MSERVWTVAIDGACRRNGKPDCTAAGGVFLYDHSTGTSHTFAVHEYKSTSQRGELIALRCALQQAAVALPCTVRIITDSEYLFNTMTKEWYKTWQRNNWCGSSGSVKNADILQDIAYHMQLLTDDNIEVMFYHIKGHVIPFGKVTAQKLLREDISGWKLFLNVFYKLNREWAVRQTSITAAQALSKRNNGYELPEDIFKKFVSMNIVVDAVATEEVERADASRES